MMTPKQQTQRQAQLTGAHNDFSKSLTAHAFFKIHNHALGEDLVQHTFIKTWSYLAKGGKIDAMKAFLYHVLNNLIVDEYRKKKASSLDVMMEKGFEPISVSTGSIETISNIMDGKAALIMIQRLPVAYQKVMKMRHVQDLSLQEISLITGQSKNTIAVQLHRGLNKLKLLADFHNI